MSCPVFITKLHHTSNKIKKKAIFLNVHKTRWTETQLMATSFQHSLKCHLFVLYRKKGIHKGLEPLLFLNNRFNSPSSAGDEKSCGVQKKSECPLQLHNDLIPEIQLMDVLNTITSEIYCTICLIYFSTS